MQLRPWQEAELADKSARKMVRACPRLGKSLVGVKFIAEHIGNGWALFLAPLGPCSDLADLSALEGLETVRGYKMSSKQLIALLATQKLQRTVLVLNYDMLPRVIEQLIKAKPAVMVCDESHKLKSPGGKWGRAARRLARYVPYLRLLTGTPAPNGPQDLWGQLSMVDSELWGKSFTAFSRKHLITDQMMYSKVIGIKDPKLVQEMFLACASVWKREDVFGPDSWQEIVRTVELPAKARNHYDRIVKDWVLNSPEDNLALNVNHTFSRMMRLQQLTSGYLPGEDGKDQAIHSAKVDAVMADLEDIIEAGEKAVIFYRFRWEGDEYGSKLRQANFNVFEIRGGQSPENSAGQISRRFNEIQGPAVCVVQTSAGGTGISLVSATHALFVSQLYSFDDERQGRDRIYSPGDRKTVTYYRVARSIDQYIGTLLDLKQDFHTALSNSTIEDISYGTSVKNRGF